MEPAAPDNPDLALRVNGSEENSGACVETKTARASSWGVAVKARFHRKYFEGVINRTPPTSVQPPPLQSHVTDACRLATSDDPLTLGPPRGWARPGTESWVGFNHSEEFCFKPMRSWFRILNCSS